MNGITLRGFPLLFRENERKSFVLEGISGRVVEKEWILGGF
jgi:hypothetical protein